MGRSEFVVCVAATLIMGVCVLLEACAPVNQSQDQSQQPEYLYQTGEVICRKLDNAKLMVLDMDYDGVWARDTYNHEHYFNNFEVQLCPNPKSSSTTTATQSDDQDPFGQ